MSGMYSGIPLPIPHLRPPFPNTQAVGGHSSPQTSAGASTSHLCSSPHLNVTGFGDTVVNNAEATAHTSIHNDHDTAAPQGTTKSLDTTSTIAGGEEQQDIKQELPAHLNLLSQQLADAGPSKESRPGSVFLVPTPDFPVPSPRASAFPLNARNESLSETDSCKRENFSLKDENTVTYSISNIDCETLENTSVSEPTQTRSSRTTDLTPTGDGQTYPGSHFVSSQHQCQVNHAMQKLVFSHGSQSVSDGIHQQQILEGNQKEEDSDAVSPPLGYAYILQSAQNDGLYQGSENYNQYLSGSSEACKEDKTYLGVYDNLLQHQIDSSYNNDQYRNHSQLSPGCLHDKMTSETRTTSAATTTSLVNPMSLLAASEDCDEESLSMVQCEGQVDQSAEFSALDLAMLQDQP